MASGIDALWLFDSFQYIDFTEDIFIQESFAIMQITEGAIGFLELKNMDFKMYEIVIRECIKINEKNCSVSGVIEND